MGFMAAAAAAAAFCVSAKYFDGKLKILLKYTHIHTYS